MNEYLRIGAAVLIGIAAFTIIYKRSNGDCVPWLLLYGSAGAGLVTYAVLKLLF